MRRNGLVDASFCAPASAGVFFAGSFIGDSADPTPETKIIAISATALARKAQVIESFLHVLRRCGNIPGYQKGKASADDQDQGKEDY